MGTIGSLSRLSTADDSASAADVVRHDDTRLSDERDPTAHASTHATAGSDPVSPASIGAQPADADLTTIAALAPSDGAYIQRASGVWVTRTAAQTLSDLGAVPTTRTVTASTGLTGGGDLSANRSFTVSYGSSSGTAVQGNDARVTADQAAGTASIRTLGTGAQQATAGNDSRLSDSRAPTGSAGGALTGTYPNPGLSVVPNAPVSLSDAATVATDASLGTLFRVTIAGNRTLGAPSNPTDGQRAIWEITASGADRTLTLTTGSSGAFLFGSDITALTPVLSAKTDFIGAVYNSTAARWRVLSYVKGY